jgi:hypothetical protein
MCCTFQKKGSTHKSSSSPSITPNSVITEKNNTTLQRSVENNDNAQKNIEFNEKMQQPISDEKEDQVQPEEEEEEEEREEEATIDDKGSNVS